MVEEVQREVLELLEQQQTSNQQGTNSEESPEISQNSDSAADEMQRNEESSTRNE
jgi:hypothetical protein